MSEFRINDHLSLKLEEGRTIIYINNERFSQCKFLLLNINVDEIKSFDEIQSIDEASERLDDSLEANQDSSVKPIKIPPEVEFWGHSSNLQVWAENRYDTRLLHRNLAFPLLKKLTEVGDSLAKAVFKEEIAKRLSSGEQNVIGFLINGQYLPYLDEIELEACFFSMPNLFKELFVKLNREKDSNTDLYENNLYYFITTLKEKEKLLEKIILDKRTNLIRCLIMIAALTPVDLELIVIINDLFKKIKNSSIDISEKLEEEIKYQFNNGSHKILLELMLDRFFEYLDNSSVESLFLNPKFTDNLLFLVEDDLKFIVDGLTEFFIMIHDEIDKKLIPRFLKSMSNDSKGRLKDRIRERIDFYKKHLEHKGELIPMSYTLLELLGN